MVASERKQRELEERELRIIDAARGMLAKEGYLGLNMDRVATQVEYSKGTIYNHFATKEDLLLAVVNDAKEKRVALFERAAAFNGTPRERMYAIGVADTIFSRLHDDSFEIEHLLRTHSVWEKTSAERQEALGCSDDRCLELCLGIVHDAVAGGDLVTTPERAQMYMHALHTMSLGTHELAQDEMMSSKYDLIEPYQALRNNLTIFLDAIHWKPLSNVWDYEQTYERIAKEVFPDEYPRVFE